MSLHQYFVAFTNTVASENAELHVLRMLPGISFYVVYTISFLEAAILLVRDGDGLLGRLAVYSLCRGWNEHDKLR